MQAQIGEVRSLISFSLYVTIYRYLCSKQTIKATSPLGDPRVTYNLEDGLVPETNMPVRFYLTPNREDGSASILVAEPLDYETTRNFMLRVRVQNVAAVPLAAFTTVYVNVTGAFFLNCSFIFLCFKYWKYFSVLPIYLSLNTTVLLCRLLFNSYNNCCDR